MTSAVVQPPAGGLALSLPPRLADRVRAYASRHGDDPTALVIEALGLVFAPGPASLVAAVLDRAPHSFTPKLSGEAMLRRNVD